MRRDRHFGELKAVDQADCAFEDKLPNLVWRGGTTSKFSDAHTERRFCRIWIARRFEELSRFDVGFSVVGGFPAKNALFPMDKLQKMIRPKLSLGEQLRYKYLLSLEGNDVASGLKWMLMSQSVVLMPKPTCASWACEALLEPFVHYVPVADDLSNLVEMVDWCEANPSLCKEIAQNGRAFAKAFENEETEKALMRAVVEAYFQNTDLVFGEDLRNRISKFTQGRISL